MIAHACSPVGTKLGMMSQFLDMNCFGIAHTPDVATLLASIHRMEKTNTRCVPSHPICDEFTSLHKQDVPRQPMLQLDETRRRGRPKKDAVLDVSSSDYDSQISEEERSPPQPTSKRRALARALPTSTRVTRARVTRGKSTTSEEEQPTPRPTPKRRAVV